MSAETSQRARAPRPGAALWLAATAALLVLGFRRRPERLGAAVRAERRDAASRGRYASTPSDISARGWMDILWRLYQRLASDRILTIAAGVTLALRKGLDRLLGRQATRSNHHYHCCLYIITSVYLIIIC